MKSLTSLAVVYFSSLVIAHGGHGHTGPEEGETIQQYARRHMAKEHHIDSFDIESFFQLHDLDRNGFWDRPEIEAVYGVHHVYSQKKSKDDIEHQKKADQIVDEVLRILDSNKDSRVSPEELSAVGLEGLPNFDHLGAEGHHYDVESEFFLHHEEEFHSTPETQTDESYNHPEDIEHFNAHESIERKENEREAKYQGITVEELEKQQAQADKENEQRQREREQQQQDEGSQQPLADSEHPTAPNPRVTRVPPPEKQDPAVRFRNAREEAERKGEWGEGEGGYQRPTKAEDKMRQVLFHWAGSVFHSPRSASRKNLPYKDRFKYKFKRNWGDF